MVRASVIVVAAACIAGSLAGCSGDRAPATNAATGAATGAAAGAAPLEEFAERGPVQITLRADHGEITVGEKLRLTLDVTAPPGVDVTMPTLGDPVGPFALRRVEDPPDVPDGDVRRWSHAWTLDTFAVGPAEIPEIVVGFVDRRSEAEGGAGVESSVTAGPMTITVVSVLRGDEAPEDYRDIKDKVALDVDAGGPRWWLLGAGLALLVAGAITAVLLARRRDRAEPAAPVIPPHLWALDELDRLAADRLIDRGEHHAFYFRLSDIVRQYIERRFGLMAPERTTEEFLRDAGRSSALSASDRDLLAGFLRAADMVKFALHEPSAAESEGAFAAARGFVERTRPHETTGAGAPATEAAA